MSTGNEDIHGILSDTYKKLDAQIDELSSASPADRPRLIDACLSGINTFSDQIKDATPYLPAYDQRLNATRVKDLSTKLSQIRQSFAPKTKFSFKSRGKAKGSIIGGALSSSTASGGASSSSTRPVPQKEHNVVVENQQNQHIQPSMPADSGSSPSLLLSGLTRCIVTLPETARFSSAAIKDVADSVLILGTALDGPAHMTNIKNSVLVLGCRQFRMHEAENVEIYLRCGSRPIIEDCKGLRFAPFAGEEGNLWDQVEDFKWLREEKSPHWSVMEVNERKGDWEMIGKGMMGSEETAKLLSKLSPA